MFDLPRLVLLIFFGDLPVAKMIMMEMIMTIFACSYRWNELGMKKQEVDLSYVLSISICDVRLIIGKIIHEIQERTIPVGER